MMRQCTFRGAGRIHTGVGGARQGPMKIVLVSHASRLADSRSEPKGIYADGGWGEPQRDRQGRAKVVELLEHKNAILEGIIKPKKMHNHLLNTPNHQKMYISHKAPIACFSGLHLSLDPDPLNKYIMVPHHGHLALSQHCICFSTNVLRVVSPALVI